MFRRERGQSIVEFALALPILTFGLIGGADLARAFAIQLAVQNGARAGAEAAAVANSPAPTPALTAARAMDELGRTPFLQNLQSTINVTFAQSDGITACLLTPTVATPCYASVRVRYTFNTIVPWPIIPNTATFDRTTTMRTMAKPSVADSCTKPAGSSVCQ